VIKYAEDRFVNVIPEIEMPGHALAALAAYPQLGNNPDKIYKTGTKWGVYDDVFMPREETCKFLENVLSEVIELFPSKYIHIGGDECPKDAVGRKPVCTRPD
jgi:hexosaminidase